LSYQNINHYYGLRNKDLRQNFPKDGWLAIQKRVN
jgi:hypothetical protein